MTFGPPDKERRILPRLSPSRRAMESGELASTSHNSPVVADDPYFIERVFQWKEGHDLGVGAELVAIGTAYPKEPAVLDAAREIAASAQFAGTPVDKAARRLLGWKSTDSRNLDSSSKAGPLDRVKLHSEVAMTRQRVWRFPRHSFAWSDLGRLYAVLGQHEKAEKTFNVALSLSPNNRFLLRTTARFYVHLDQKDRALRLLRNADITRYDPWLMSAEVAVSQSAGVSSKFAARGFKELDTGHWNAHSTSELRGSLATLLLRDGAASKARKPD
jgi:tetratricopeptide (TPR) repeat protein